MGAFTQAEMRALLSEALRGDVPLRAAWYSPRLERECRSVVKVEVVGVVSHRARLIDLTTGRPDDVPHADIHYARTLAAWERREA